jgi:hypothetical protein
MNRGFAVESAEVSSTFIFSTSAAAVAGGTAPPDDVPSPEEEEDAEGAEDKLDDMCSFKMFLKNNLK